MSSFIAAAPQQVAGAGDVGHTEPQPTPAALAIPPAQTIPLDGPSPFADSIPIDIPRRPPSILEKPKRKARRLPVAHARTLEEKCWACPAVQAEGSLYCHLHSCIATNADGSSCGNEVTNPRRSRYCSTGYHPENGRYSIVVDILEHRKAQEAQESSARALQLERDLEYFEEHFAPHIPVGDGSTSSSSIQPRSIASWRSSTEGRQKTFGMNAFGMDRRSEGTWSRSGLEGAAGR